MELADDDFFGYQDGSEQLSDYAERFGLLFERLRTIRDSCRSPRRSCLSVCEKSCSKA